MNNLALKELIHSLKEEGKKVALCFCAHVPVEVLDAAPGSPNVASKIMINNVCPLVKEMCNLLEDDAVSEADLIIAETSCDGKKKMYELIARQEQIYYYQVPQGSEQEYVLPLIRSEIRFLIKEMKKRFDIDVTEEALRKASALRNEEREAVMKLMEVQKHLPSPAWGSEIYRILDDAQLIGDVSARIQYYKEKAESFLAAAPKAPKNAPRILLTGCPLSAVYEKVTAAIEKNGGVVVCFENCEAVKTNVRHVDLTNPDMVAAIADCYQNTACAIMSPNVRRLNLLRELCKDYQVDGIIDITLPTCHPYSVERDTIGIFADKALFCSIDAESTVCYFTFHI